MVFARVGRCNVQMIWFGDVVLLRISLEILFCLLCWSVGLYFVPD